MACVLLFLYFSDSLFRLGKRNSGSPSHICIRCLTINYIECKISKVWPKKPNQTRQPLAKPKSTKGEKQMNPRTTLPPNQKTKPPNKQTQNEAKTATDASYNQWKRAWMFSFYCNECIESPLIFKTGHTRVCRQQFLNRAQECIMIQLIFCDFCIRKSFGRGLFFP